MTNRILLAFYLCVSVIGFPVFGQVEKDLRFSHLTVDDGLSQSTVTSISKDRHGFLWIGTLDGLNRYDGYRFDVYNRSKSKERWLPNNRIQCVYKDSDDLLWVGMMGGGLVYYNERSKGFTPIPLVGSTDSTGSGISVNALCEDDQGKLWIGTYTNLYSYSKNTGKVQLLQLDQYLKSQRPLMIQSLAFLEGKLWIGSKEGLWLLDLSTYTAKQLTGKLTSESGSRTVDVRSLLVVNNQVWAGTDLGLFLCDETQNLYKRYSANGDRNRSLFQNMVTSICETGDGNLWVGTEESLEYFNTKTETFRHFRSDVQDEQTLNHNSVRALYQDDQKILWVGTYMGGINKQDPNQTFFHSVQSKVITEGFSASAISAFAELDEGKVFVGSDGGSLNLWDRSTNRFRHYEAFAPSGFPSHSALCLLVDRSKKYLWVGTYGHGLKRLNLEDNSLKSYDAGLDAFHLNDPNVFALMQDRQGQIWIGTNNGGVNVLNPESGSIRKMRAGSSDTSLSNDCIRAFCQASDGRVWIGTYSGGISVYSPSDDSFTRLNAGNASLQSDIVLSIAEDRRGTIWVGTMGGGLAKFDPVKQAFSSFDEEDGLANDVVNCIVEDDDGRLWLSTNRGISYFDLQNRAFENFNTLHGLQGNEFSHGAGLKLRNGEILFGGNNGMSTISSQDIVRNEAVPPVRFTDVSHYGSAFTAEFAALSYTLPGLNSYQYKLMGFDSDWVSSGHQRSVSYTNLDPGSYTLLVKAANNDGHWNQEAEAVKIIIHPPWYRTVWAYLAYSLFSLSIILFVFFQWRARSRLRQRIRLEKFAAKKNEELQTAKIEFFTQVSHELRTPLSLILDPLKRITGSAADKDRVLRYAHLAMKNADRLSGIVNQLLEYRRLSAQPVQLEKQPVGLNSWLKNFCEPFFNHGEERAVRFELINHLPAYELQVDAEKLERVLQNLISNAFKYTPNGGLVRVNGYLVAEEPESIVFEVSDTGLGIPEKDQAHIFDLFYQVKNNTPFENASTGIGLAVAKELVQVQKGTIELNSVVGEGTCFRIFIPVEQTATVRSEIELGSIVSSHKAEADEGGVNESQENLQETLADRPLLLIIEDNEDLRTYLCAELKRDMEIISASNGKSGLKLALEQIPDIVLSDVMMPEMDGLTCCRKLKEDVRTSHIPVALLTARHHDEHKILGYDAGADAYIEKPFNVDVIRSRLMNLWSSRRKLRQLFSEPGGQDEALNQLSERDQVFLSQAEEAVRLRWTATTVDELSAALRMSRRQLYRKLKALTSQSVQEFITSVAINEAKKRLKQTTFSISEIAYQLGFSEASNFSRTFNKEVGMSPKKFIQQLQEPTKR